MSAESVKAIPHSVIKALPKGICDILADDDETEKYINDVVSGRISAAAEQSEEQAKDIAHAEATAIEYFEPERISQIIQLAFTAKVFEHLTEKQAE